MEENIQIIISVHGEDTFNVTLPRRNARQSILINTSLNAMDEKEEQILRYDIPITLSNATEACTILFTYLLHIVQIHERLNTENTAERNIYEEILFGKILSDDLLFDLLILSVRFDIPFLVNFLSINLAIIIKKNNVVSLRKRFHIHNIHRTSAPVGTLVQLKGLGYYDVNGTEARIVKHGDKGKTVVVNSNETGQNIIVSYDKIDIVDTDRFTMLWFTLFYNQNPICLFLNNDDKHKLESLQDDKPDTLFTTKVKQVPAMLWNRKRINLEFSWLEWCLSWTDLNNWSNWTKAIVGTNISIVSILLSAGFTRKQIFKIYLALALGTIDLIGLIINIVAITRQPPVR
jgi:hypothetical protein